MRKILLNIGLGLLLVSSAFATYTDDPRLHATFVGQKRVDHTQKIIQELPDRMYVYYDGRLPADKRLRYSAKGQLIEFTCPAVANVAALAKPRPMGVFPIFMPMDNPTQVEVLSAIYEGQAMGPIAGRYELLGPPVVLNSVSQNCIRINTLRIRCSSGLDDGMPVLIDYRETHHEIVNPWNLNLKRIPNDNARQCDAPKGANLPPCFTFSCWYKSTGTTPTLAPVALFELIVKATEPDIKDQFKRLSLKVSNAADKAHLYAALIASKDHVRTEKVKTGTKKELKQAAVQEKVTIEKVTTGQFTIRNVLVVLSEEEKKHYWKSGGAGVVQINGRAIELRGGKKYGSFFDVTRQPTYKDEKKVLIEAAPAVYEEKPVFEDKTIHELKDLAMVDCWIPKYGWMNFVMHVDAQTKLAKVFCNGKQILSVVTHFPYSLNTPHIWIVGAQHAGLMAEMHVIQGQLVPVSKFCCYNSQNEVVPVKYEGSHGVDGYKVNK